MKSFWLALAVGSSLIVKMDAQSNPPPPSVQEDPYVWLEDITGEKALNWARERNGEAAAELEGNDSFRALETQILEILDSNFKLPYVTKYGAYFYNLWRDSQHPRGLWRRTTLEEYRKAEPQWEVVLDVDALGAAEKESWVFHGAEFLKPDYRRCLVSLSRGGSDASEVREFDTQTKTFVENGFRLPQAKSNVSWIDRDTLFVGTDFGPNSMTTSGYPRVAKRWKRGEALSEAKTVYEAEATDMTAEAFHDATPGFERDFITRRPSFFTNEQYLIKADGSKQKIDLPLDAESDVHREWLTIKLRTPWSVNGRTYTSGSLLAARFDDYIAGKRELTVLFEPTDSTSLSGHTWTRSRLILNVLDDVKSKLHVLLPSEGAWKREPLQGAPEIGTVSVHAVDRDESDRFFMTVTGFLSPTTLNYGGPGEELEKLKASPAFFETAGLEVSQHFTTSKDGTKIPYFQVCRSGLSLNGTHPTLLSGYGGFEISRVPGYNSVLGRAWLAQGGVYILANIRGGGEYGPKWHQAALKANRFRAYEDFAAVAQDLIARKVTSPKHLGCEGGSNGGLLVGNMLTRYPELFGAIVCQIPLLDMKRYSHLLAGASWMAEYGDPDKPEEWDYIKTFSPYHNLQPGVAYPPVLFMSTTRDDRVHPGHARKMVARMKEMGCDVRYFENMEGGHGAGADNRQSAHFWALAYSFLHQKLK